MILDCENLYKWFVMRKLLFVILVSSLILGLGFAKDGSVPTVKAALSIHQGDLILSGNNVTTIENMIFHINGSIIVENNATLILHNAVLNFTQSAFYEHNMTLRNAANGNPRLQSDNSEITSNLQYFMVQLYDNSSATISNSANTAYLRLFSSAVAYVSNSSIAFFETYSSAVASFFNSTFGYAYADYPSTLIVSNSEIDSLEIGSASVNCSFVNIRPGFFNYWDYQSNSSLLIGPGGGAANVTLNNTEIDNWELGFWGASNVTIRDSALSILFSYDFSTVWLFNTTVASPYFWNKGEVYVSWYLDAHVIDGTGQNVPTANVTAFYSNSTLSDSKLTDMSGKATLTLMEKMMNATGSYAVGNYTIHASYLAYSNFTTINMTQSQEVTLTLSNLNIPEFPSFLVLPLFMMATLMAVVMYTKKKETSCKHPEKRPKSGECSQEQIAECHPKAKAHQCK